MSSLVSAATLSSTTAVPSTSLPPRKRAKTQAEKEQRRLERILRNRRAAHASREKKRKHVEYMEAYCNDLELNVDTLKSDLVEALALIPRHLQGLFVPSNLKDTATLREKIHINMQSLPERGDDDTGDHADDFPLSELSFDKSNTISSGRKRPKPLTLVSYPSSSSSSSSSSSDRDACSYLSPVSMNLSIASPGDADYSSSTAMSLSNAGGATNYNKNDDWEGRDYGASPDSLDHHQQQQHIIPSDNYIFAENVAGDEESLGQSHLQTTTLKSEFDGNPFFDLHHSSLGDDCRESPLQLRPQQPRRETHHNQYQYNQKNHSSGCDLMAGSPLPLAPAATSLLMNMESPTSSIAAAADPGFGFMGQNSAAILHSKTMNMRRQFPLCEMAPQSTYPVMANTAAHVNGFY